MSKASKREYTPQQQNSGNWFAITWHDRSDVVDVYLKVKHSHADKSYSGKETEEDVHVMLTLEELLQMDQSIHEVIVGRLKR